VDLAKHPDDKRTAFWILFCVLFFCSGCGNTVHTAKIARAQNVLLDFVEDMNSSLESSANPEGVDLTELVQKYNAKSDETRVSVFVSKERVVEWSEENVRLIAFSYVPGLDGNREAVYVCLYSNGNVEKELASKFPGF